MTHRAGTCRYCCRLVPYLVLLRVGFAMPAPSLPRRCALTAPFHPYPAHLRNPVHSCWSPNLAGPFTMKRLPKWAGRYIFCGTFRPADLNRPSRTLSGTLLCGVRTFLPAHSGRSWHARELLSEWAERSSGPAAYSLIIRQAICRIVWSHVSDRIILHVSY